MLVNQFHYHLVYTYNMLFSDWLDQKEISDIRNFIGEEVLSEGQQTRYSIEVNYRSDFQEILEAFAKIALGYISAALKKRDYHVKHVFSEKPLRILVSTRNWDDGEWVAVVIYNPNLNCFVMGKGFYNRNRRSVQIQNHKKCTGKSAAEVAHELLNFMEELKKLKPRDSHRLKKAPLKRGPKG